MISVIIPCLNEEDNLARLLGQLIEQKNISLEIIVVDGGSKDNTTLRAAEYGARVIFSGRGRGRQQNAGAAEATLTDAQLHDLDNRRARAITAYKEILSIAKQTYVNVAILEAARAGLSTPYRLQLEQ